MTKHHLSVIVIKEYVLHISDSFVFSIFYGVYKVSLFLLPCLQEMKF